MKKSFRIVIGALSLLVVGYVAVAYYSYIFAKTIEGRVIGLSRVNEPTAIMGTGIPIPPSQLFSFSVAIRDGHGEIFTASSEDRQWAVVREGMCARAKFYPYPPWQLGQAGTFHGARLIKLYDCPNSGG